jgi:hypothetical protein
MSVVVGWVMRLGLITRLLAPDRANCPVLVKGAPPRVTPAMALTAVPIGAVKIPVANATELPVGSAVLSIAIRRVWVTVASTLATTCAGKKLGRRAT